MCCGGSSKKKSKPLLSKNGHMTEAERQRLKGIAERAYKREGYCMSYRPTREMQANFDRRLREEIRKGIDAADARGEWGERLSRNAFEKKRR